MIPKEIRQQMKQIQLHSKAYFMKSEGGFRLCHIENKRYKYIVIPYCDCSALIKAAQVLKQCHIIDNYNAVKLNAEYFYVKMEKFNGIYTNTDAEGEKSRCKSWKVIEWSELKITKSKAKEFIVRMKSIATVTASITSTPHYYKHSKQTA